jgi:hypothetical protein
MASIREQAGGHGLFKKSVRRLWPIKEVYQMVVANTGGQSAGLAQFRRSVRRSWPISEVSQKVTASTRCQSGGQASTKDQSGGHGQY